MKTNKILQFHALSLLVMVLFLGGFGGYKAYAQTTPEANPNTTEQTIASKESSNIGLALLGGGIAFGLAALGAGIAVGNASSAAIGAISEKPSMFGQALVFVALGEGIMIIGFVMAFILMNRV